MYKPAYFTEIEDEICGEKAYKFNNNYWDKRKNNDWQDSPDLF